MRFRKKSETFSGSEAFLPLVLFSGLDIFYAAGFALAGAGLTLVVLELLRRQSTQALGAFYLFWLVAGAGTVWLLCGLPPYWVLCTHLLVPEAVRAPSAAQREKPFGFGLKKYSGKRMREWLFLLLAAAAFALFVYFLRLEIRGFSVWLFAAPAALLAEAFVQKIGRSGA